MTLFMTLFSIFKNGRAGLPSPPSFTPVSVTEYALISLNMPNCPSNGLINCSDYARTMNIHNDLTYLTCLKVGLFFLYIFKSMRYLHDIQLAM